MPDKKITLFAESPIKVGGKRKYQETFEVDTQEDADALIACGAASDPSAKSEEVVSAEEQAAAEKAAAEKAAAEKAAAEKAAAEKAAAEKAAAEKAATEKAAAEKKAAEKTGATSNVVQLKKAPEDAVERLAVIKAATEELVLVRNEENFTNNNGPTVDALEAKLGWTPKAAERNQVWVDLDPAE